MDHLEALSLLDGRRDGGLDAGQSRALKAHLAACADCRAVAARWPAAPPVAYLRPRVLAALRPAPARPAWALPAWAAPLGVAAALLLLLTAFWRPERGWVEADAGFADTSAVRLNLPLRGGL